MFIGWFGGKSASKKKRKNNNSPQGYGNNAEYLLVNNYRSTKTLQTVTPDTAKGLSAYMACMRVVSEDIAKLPVDIYTLDGNVKKNANPDVSRMLNFKPNPYINAITFREVITGHALGWGLGIAEIQRNKFDEPIAMWIIHPSRVAYQKDNKGKIIWQIANDDNTHTYIDNKDIFKICGFGDDGIVGQAAASVGAESLGEALAQQDYSGAFYTNGGTLTGILEVGGKLDSGAVSRIRESWSKIYGGASNAHKVAVLEQGTKFTPLSILPADAQFIETRQFSVEDICRWFRVAPHKIQSLQRSTNNNIAAQDIHHATDTLHPWAVRWEQEIVNKLLQENELAKINFAELLRGDNVSRAKYLNDRFMIGSMSPDDVRIYEGDNPRSDGRGHEYFTPVNMMTPDERDRSKSQADIKQSNNTVDKKLAVTRILEPFAIKEMKAISKAIDGKPVPENFFESNISQMQNALADLVTTRDIVAARAKYLTGYRLSKEYENTLNCDIILNDLIGYFIGDDDGTT